MRLKRAPTGTTCDDCNKVPANVCLYDPDLVGAFCGGCCYARLLEALRSKRITMQRLKEISKSLIDEMSEEELIRMYVDATIEGLIKGDPN